MNVFLICKCCFYYYYIKRFKESFKDENNSVVGSLFYEFLKEVYEKDKIFYVLEERFIWFLEIRENIIFKECLDIFVVFKKI